MNLPTNRRPIEHELERALADTATRIVTDAESPPPFVPRAVAGPRDRRWLTPALAMAAVIAVVILSVTVTAAINHHSHPAPAVPVAPVSTSPAPSSPAPSASSSSAPRRQTPSTPAACTTSQLTLTEGGGNGAGGTSYITYYFTNISTVTCTLTGYPGVAVLDAAGSVVQHPATRSPYVGTTGSAVTTVRIAPRGRAEFVLASTDNTPNPNCTTLFTGTQLQVYPPNTTTPLRLPGTYHICDLRVGPVELPR